MGLLPRIYVIRDRGSHDEIPSLAPASIDLLGQVFNLSEGEQRLLMSDGIGEGIFFAGNTHVAIRVVASPKEHQLITTNPAEILARQNR